MGLDHYTARFLLQAKRSGVVFGKTLTIGRQNFFVLGPQLQKLGREFGFDSRQFLASYTPDQLVYIEPFLSSVLGASAVESIDVSNYEAATHVHDLNQPLPEKLRGQFDTVLEAGSLEHIFNFPTAIGNLMQALKPGGRLFIQTPANNYFGHGFYQFSAELFYRVLNEANGFKVERMQLLEHFFPSHFFKTDLYEVADPAQVRKRVQLVNNRPSLLLVEARKLEEKPLFQITPQQSDYVPLWDASQETTKGHAVACFRSGFKERLYATPLKLWGNLFMQYLLNRGNKPSVKNEEFFRSV